MQLKDFVTFPNLSTYSQRQDERLIETTIAFLKDFADKGYENAVECIDWLKSLRPDSYKNCNSRWKPSEEQMNRLSSIIAALRKDNCDDMADFLASIYHNLEKLM